MTGESADELRAKAEKLVTGTHDPASDEIRTLVVEALAVDLAAAADAAAVMEDRLEKVEAQTRVLSEAVIAITQPPDGVAPAVQAVKDEM